MLKKPSRSFHSSPISFSQSRACVRHPRRARRSVDWHSQTFYRSWSSSRLAGFPPHRKPSSRKARACRFCALVGFRSYSRCKNGKFAPLSSIPSTMLLPQPFFFHGFALLPGCGTPLCPSEQACQFRMVREVLFFDGELTT